MGCTSEVCRAFGGCIAAVYHTAEAAAEGTAAGNIVAEDTVENIVAGNTVA